VNNSFIIPEQFRLNNRIIKVIVDDDYCNEHGFVGEADFTEKVITLCDKFVVKELQKLKKKRPITMSLST